MLPTAHWQEKKRSCLRTLLSPNLIAVVVFKLICFIPLPTCSCWTLCTGIMTTCLSCSLLTTLAWVPIAEHSGCTFLDVLCKDLDFSLLQFTLSSPFASPYTLPFWLTVRSLNTALWEGLPPPSLVWVSLGFEGCFRHILCFSYCSPTIDPVGLLPNDISSPSHIFHLLHYDSSLWHVSYGSLSYPVIPRTGGGRGKGKGCGFFPIGQVKNFVRIFSMPS